MEAEHSPFSINIIELLVAIGTTIITWFGFHASISSYWPVGLNLETPLPEWVIAKRETLFHEWAIPITLILATSSIFFVRGIGNERIQYFSRFNHFALAWPLLLFPLVTYLSIFSLLCFPIGLMLPVLSLAETNKSRRWWGWMFTTIWLISCTIIAWYYFGRIDYLFGD